MGRLLLVTLISLFLVACSDPLIPKPKGYFRIDFPERDYRVFESGLCPFSFEYPVYTTIVYDTLYFDSVVMDQCWINVEFEQFNGKLHLSYKEINEEITLMTLIEDAHSLTFVHTRKASSIDESRLVNPNGIHGLLYEVSGDAASSLQFFMTDSISHYLRGSLYFMVSPNADSLKPVVEFVKEDVWHMINSLKWDSDI